VVRCSSELSTAESTDQLTHRTPQQPVGSTCRRSCLRDIAVVHHIVSDHLARCTIRQELAASPVASLVLSHQYSAQRERERHTWVPLAVVGLVHVVATLIHCWNCDLFGLLTLELLICRCITVELQDDNLDVMADRRQRFRYMYIYSCTVAVDKWPRTGVIAPFSTACSQVHAAWVILVQSITQLFNACISLLAHILFVSLSL
jgi:hypothetical protein